VALCGLNVNSFRVVDGSVILNNGGNFCTILSKELGSPVAYVSKALDYNCLSLDSRSKAYLFVERRHGEELASTIVHSKASRLGPALDTSLVDEFSSANTLRVDVLASLPALVGVLNPGHNLLVSAHVGAQAIDLGADEVLLDELHCVATGHALDFSLRIFSWVDCDSTLGAAEGDVGDCKFEGHERGKGHGLLQIDLL
jgi:hypothetical protein